MRRILIFGNSGAGKSTLAKAYCLQYGLAHLDLDTLAWNEGSIPTRRPLADSGMEIRRFMARHKEWVIEGCYTDLLLLAASQAREAIFLNPGTEQCVANCRRRAWEPHKYDSKQAQDENLDMLVDWVRQYADRTDECSLASHTALYASFQGRKRELHGNPEMAD